jgi:hypothetical protein
MMRIAALLLAGTCLGAQAQEQEIQRALVQRDQQSAEFAAGAHAPALSSLHARQLGDVMAIPLAPELRPYQRFRMAEERELVFAPPVVKSGSEPDFRGSSKSGSDPDFTAPLALPGGARSGVDPVLPQGLPY